MDFLEKDLEDIICENIKKVSERGFCDLSWGELDRQSRLPSGKIADMVVYDLDEQRNYIRFTVIELKRGEIDVTALLQSISYFTELIDSALPPHACDASIVLCGKSISPSVIELCKMMKNVELYEYKYSFDGILFINRSENFFETLQRQNELMKAV